MGLGLVLRGGGELRLKRANERAGWAMIRKGRRGSLLQGSPGFAIEIVKLLAEGKGRRDEKLKGCDVILNFEFERMGY